jgi:hypothetical protein
MRIMTIKARFMIITILTLFSSLTQAEYRELELVTLFDDVTTDKQTYNQLKRNNIAMETIAHLCDKIRHSDSKENIEYAYDEKIVIYLNKREKRIHSVIINEPKKTHSCREE